MYVGLQSAINANRRKTVFFLLMFPVFLFGLIYLSFIGISLADGMSLVDSVASTNELSSFVFSILGPVIIIRGVISFYGHRQMIFKFTGAYPVSRETHPQIYNIVENLCISRGLPTPKIGIINDHSMNAFALGWKPENAWIVFSEGILEKLNDDEIEAVAAHELTHIINKDSLLMIIIVIVIGIVATLGEILFRVGVRMKGGKKNPGPLLALVGIILLLIGYIIFPLLRLAISRKREYLADAGSVELTKSAHAMVSALKKISTDATIEQIKQPSIGAMCIENPFGESRYRFRGLLSTHPTIEDRIAQLQSFG